MAGSFGGAVKLSGESEYRRALSQITSNLKELKSEMGLVSSEYDKNDKSTEALTARSEVLQKTLDKQKEKVSVLEKQFESLSKQQEENVKKHEELQKKYDEEVKKLEEIKRQSGENSREYEQQAQAISEMSSELSKSSKALDTNEKELSNVKTALNNAKAETNKTSKELDSLQKEEQDTTKGTKDMSGSMDTYAKSTDKAGKSSISFGDIIKANVISEAIIGGFKALASAIGKVAGAMKDAVTDGAAYADEVITLSSTMSMSTDRIQEYMYMSNLVDVSVETLAGSMKKLTSNMKTALTGNGEAAELFEQMDINLKNADGTLRTTEDIFYDVFDALSGMQDETERNMVAMTLFGKSASELNPLIDAGADRIKELRQEAHDTGYVLSGEALGALGETQDAFDTLDVAIQGVKNNLAARLAPAINDIAKKFLPEFTKKTNELFDALDEGGLEGFADKLMEIVGEILEKVPEVLPQILEGITEKLPLVLETVIGVFNSVLQTLLEALPKLIPVVLDGVLLIVNTLIDNLPTIVSTAMQIILALVQGLTEAMPQLIPTIFNAIEMIVRTILDNLPLIIQSGIQLIVALIQGIAKEIPELVKFIPEIIKTVVKIIIESLPMILDAAGDIIFALIEGLVEAIPDLVEMVPDIIVSIVETLVTNFPKILEAGKRLIEKLIEGIKNMFGALGKEAGKIWEKIKEGIGDIWTKAKTIGKDFIEGIWQGIQNAGNWLWEKVKGFGNDVVDTFKNIFGIHSPSKVFSDEIGTNLALGIGSGFEKSMKNVSNEMAEAIPTSFDINTNIKNNVQKPLSVSDIANIFVGVLKDMKIELDDEVAGRFVTRRVEMEVFG